MDMFWLMLIGIKEKLKTIFIQQSRQISILKSYFHYFSKNILVLLHFHQETIRICMTSALLSVIHDRKIDI